MDLERDYLRGVAPVHVLHQAAMDPVHGVWGSSELAWGWRVPARLRDLVGEVIGEILAEEPTSPGRTQ